MHFYPLWDWKLITSVFSKNMMGKEFLRLAHLRCVTSCVVEHGSLYKGGSAEDARGDVDRGKLSTQESAPVNKLVPATSLLWAL